MLTHCDVALSHVLSIACIEKSEKYSALVHPKDQFSGKVDHLAVHLATNISLRPQDDQLFSQAALGPYQQHSVVGRGVGWLTNLTLVSYLLLRSQNLSFSTNKTQKRYKLTFQLIVGVVKRCVIQNICLLRDVITLDRDLVWPDQRKCLLPDTEFPAFFSQLQSWRNA